MPNHQTAAAAFYRQRREEFAANAANRILADMRRGQTLRLQYQKGRPLWTLSDGRLVSAGVAEILTQHALVVPTDGALFLELPGQVWRYRLINDAAGHPQSWRAADGR